MLDIGKSYESGLKVDVVVAAAVGLDGGRRCLEVGGRGSRL